MWTEYRDKAKAKRTFYLEDARRHVFDALAQGYSKPPQNAALADVIEAMWAQLAKQNKVTKTFPTHD